MGEWVKKREITYISVGMGLIPQYTPTPLHPLLRILELYFYFPIKCFGFRPFLRRSFVFRPFASVSKCFVSVADLAGAGTQALSRPNFFLFPCSFLENLAEFGWLALHGKSWIWAWSWVKSYVEAYLHFLTPKPNCFNKISRTEKSLWWLASRRVQNKSSCLVWVKSYVEAYLHF